MNEIRYSQQNIFCRKALEKLLKYVLENIIYIRYFIRGKWNLLLMLPTMMMTFLMLLQLYTEGNILGLHVLTSNSINFQK